MARQRALKLKVLVHGSSKAAIVGAVMRFTTVARLQRPMAPEPAHFEFLRALRTPRQSARSHVGALDYSLINHVDPLCDQTYAFSIARLFRMVIA